MKHIRLDNGMVTMVSDYRLDYLNQFKWKAQVGKTKCYAYRSAKINGEWRIIKMHEEIMGRNWIDHIDGNSLNNQDENLRPCTPQQNARSRKPNSNGSSIYKGVSWNEPQRKWVAKIRYDGKTHHLGSFIGEVDAANAYNRAADEHFGEFARLNY